jgi:hypothetical protein
MASAGPLRVLEFYSGIGGLVRLLHLVLHSFWGVFFEVFSRSLLGLTETCAMSFLWKDVFLLLEAVALCKWAEFDCGVER